MYTMAVIDIRTVGALKGKLSGSVKVNRKVPPLYGLSDWRDCYNSSASTVIQE